MASKRSTKQDQFVEDYLRLLLQEMPGSSSALWFRVGGRVQVDDRKLLRILKLSKKGEVFRHCTELQVALLFLTVGGRIFIPPQKQNTFKDKTSDGYAKPLTRREIAEYFGLSLSEYKRQMELGRHALQCAINDYYNECGRCAA